MPIHEARPYIPQLPNYLQEKVIQCGQSNEGDKWSHFDFDELDVLSKQFLMFGSSFRERLHRSITTRLHTKADARKNEWLPEVQRYMPIIIEYDEIEFSKRNNEGKVVLDDVQLSVNESIVWSALTAVSNEVGIPISRVEWLQNHPGLDTEMMITSREGKTFYGESVLAHEFRHSAKTRELTKSPSYVLLDFDIVDLGNGPEIVRNTSALSFYDFEDTSARVQMYLAPRFPSQPDMKYAFETDPKLALAILREKAAYHFLSNENQRYVEAIYMSDPRRVTNILSVVQNELCGLSRLNWVDQNKLAWRKFPWDEEIPASPHFVHVPQFAAASTGHNTNRNGVRIR